MNDIYLKLANSQYAQPIFQALNLPQPLTLKRSSESPLDMPHGSYLIAATKGNFALNTILKSLDSEHNNLVIARSNEATLSLSAAPANFQASCNELQVENPGSQKFNALIFDATGIKTADELKNVYQFFHHSIRKLKRNGRILLITQDCHASFSNTKVEHSAIQGGIIGFVKSLAKESGKKGITSNLIAIEKGSQKYLATSLYYFLSGKSAYVTGQQVSLGNKAAKQSKVNWKQPLTGKTAIVTGAAQGIGYETAKVLARDGATVVCLDIPSNETLTKALAQDINGHSLSIDLSEENAVEKLISVVSSQLGVIDIIVHNAGITRDKTIANMPSHFWDQVLNINLKKVIAINEALLSKNALSSEARIICISSISGIAGNFGQSNYALSKAGIAAYTESLSYQLINNRQDGITINAIAPGFIETQMTQKIPFMTREFGRRLNSLSQGGLPSDIAEGVAFFCHPASSSLNGNLLRICGQSLIGK